HDPLAMSVIEQVADLGCHLDDAGRLDPHLFVEDLPQCPALDIFLEYVSPFVILPDAEDGDECWMAQLGDFLCLPQEPVDHVGGIGCGGGVSLCRKFPL